jgi:hypothetical protein
LVDKKPTLTLPKKIKPPSPPDERYGDVLTDMTVAEWKRAEYDKTVALAALMERIVADEPLFLTLAMSHIRRSCRKKLKNLNRARQMAMRMTKESL